MLDKFEAHFFYTSDSPSIRIYHEVNFKKEDYDPKSPLLVFNYGLVCSNAHWQKQLPFFHDQGYQILIHDYRGHYSSSELEDLSSCTFENMSKDLYELLSSFEAKNVHMVGHSMGVNITLEFAIRYQELLSGMTLIAGTVLPPQDHMFNSDIIAKLFPYAELITKSFPKAFKTIWKTSYLNPLVREGLFRGGFNTSEVSREFIVTYMEKMRTLPPDILLHLMAEMRDQNLGEQLHKVTVPTLLMGGDKDQVIPVEMQHFLKEKIPHAKLEIIKDGSHVPQMDFPRSINNRILEFLQNDD